MFTSLSVENTDAIINQKREPTYVTMCVYQVYGIYFACCTFSATGYEI